MPYPVFDVRRTPVRTLLYYTTFPYLTWLFITGGKTAVRLVPGTVRLPSRQYVPARCCHRAL